MGATCPNFSKDSLEPIAGQFDTGVVAPDGYRETVYEEGYQCFKCGAYTDDSELDDEPRYRKVKCSRCGEPTTYDPTYGDLCYRHIRADNE